MSYKELVDSYHEEIERLEEIIWDLQAELKELEERSKKNLEVLLEVLND